MLNLQELSGALRPRSRGWLDRYDFDVPGNTVGSHIVQLIGAKIASPNMKLPNTKLNIGDFHS